MSHFFNFFSKPPPHESNSPEGLVITVECPYCKEFIDIEEPDDNPPTGKKKSEGWCGGCGKRFVFFY